MAHCWGLGGATTDLFFPLSPDKGRPGYLALPDDVKPLRRLPPHSTRPEPAGRQGWSAAGSAWRVAPGRGLARVAAVDPGGWFHYVARPDGKGLDMAADGFWSPPVWIPGRMAFVATVGADLWLCELGVEQPSTGRPGK